ncbi:MAG: hypothetical protein GEU93_13820 [Propionibacteriales bacterium]|nr:hypothetical protein [Propionibacteriales bacterium]
MARPWASAAAALSAIGVSLLIAAPVASGAPGGGASEDQKPGDPPGNNGVVKVNDEELDDIPNNDPHVDCVFNVDFYNYDEGDDYAADVEFTLHNPTGDGTFDVTSGDLAPYIGEDPAGGGKDVDARETYRLEFTGDPHPQQGYHVKLTIHAPGSIGADVKHKVFWVQPCSEEGAEPTPPAPGHSSPNSPPEEQPAPPVPTVVEAGFGPSGDPAGQESAAGTWLVLVLALTAGSAVLVPAGLVPLARRGRYEI